MTKLDVLKQTQEEVRSKYEAAHKEICDVFNSVKEGFAFPETEMEISVRNSWGREIDIRFKNEVMQWCSETMRVYLKPMKEVDAYELSFNYGSGGWNEGIDAQHQLRYMEDILRSTRLAHNIANDSWVTLDCALDKFFAIQEHYSEIGSQIREIENNAKEAEKDAKRLEVMEALKPFGITQAKTGAQYFAEMSEGQSGYWNDQRYIAYVNISDEGLISFAHGSIEIDKYQKTVIKVNGDRISYKALQEKGFEGCVEFPRELRWNNAVRSYRGADLGTIVKGLSEVEED